MVTAHGLRLFWENEREERQTMRDEQMDLYVCMSVCEWVYFWVDQHGWQSANEHERTETGSAVLLFDDRLFVRDTSADRHSRSTPLPTSTLTDIVVIDNH